MNKSTKKTKKHKSENVEKRHTYPRTEPSVNYLADRKNIQSVKYVQNPKTYRQVKGNLYNIWKSNTNVEQTQQNKDILHQ